MTKLIEPRRWKRAVFGALVLLTCISASSASFDCSKAHSTSERPICSDPKLSAMDVRLARLAAEGKKRAPSRRNFQRELDAAWQVRQRCDNAACVELWYLKRIAVLSGAQTVPAAPTEAPPSASAADPRPAAKRPVAPPAAVAPTTALPQAGRTAAAPAQVVAIQIPPEASRTMGAPPQVAATPAAPVPLPMCRPRPWRQQSRCAQCRTASEAAPSASGNRSDRGKRTSERQPRRPAPGHRWRTGLRCAAYQGRFPVPLQRRRWPMRRKCEFH